MKNRKLTSISLLCLLLSAAFTLGGCVNLEVLARKCESVTVKTAGEDDYAFRYTVEVRNKGKKGKVRAKAKLFTPEGQFYREQVAAINSDEVMTFEFTFTEPTVPGTLLSEEKVRCEFSYDSLD